MQSVPDEIPPQLCANCNSPLVKQLLSRDGTPAETYDTEGVCTFVAGKHAGRLFDEVHKNTILKYVRASEVAAIWYFQNHPENYCALHRFLLHKWPGTNVHVRCGCYGFKDTFTTFWSCPTCGNERAAARLGP